MTKEFRYSAFVLLAFCSISALFSCIGITSTQEVRLIDSLNLRSYNYRYKNPDIAYKSAFKAYNQAQSYSQGRAEACNNIAFVEYQRMNYEAAKKFYQQVYDLTQNELEQTIADIGMMAVCQRTAMNKDFYDYRNSALRHMKRIEENHTLYIEKNERQRLNFAKTEFYLVSATYHFYLQQNNEAIFSINHIEAYDLKGDTAQTLSYLYLKGLIGAVNQNNSEQYVVNRFDQFYECWKQSCNGYTYFTAMSLQQIGSLLQVQKNLNIVRQYRPNAIELLGNTQKADFILRTLQEAQHIFNRFRDFYHMTATSVSIGEYLNIQGKYKTAIDSLSRGLDYISTQHKIYYPEQKGEWLYPFDSTDSIYTELNWITNEHVKTAPEWIARIREQLSVSYAGLSEKIPSDYNRNIYLDLMNYTRQDKELESRSKYLEHEDHLLTFISFSVLIALILLITLFLILNKRYKRKNRLYISRLRGTLDLCQSVTASLKSDIESTEDISKSVEKAIAKDMYSLFGVTDMKIISLEDRGEEAIDLIDNPEETSNKHQYTYPIYQTNDTIQIGTWKLGSERSFTKDDVAMINVIKPYIGWTLKNGLTLLSLGDERKQLEKQYYIVEQHIEDNKRSNLIKKSCLSIVYGITPYIDRIINEVSKLSLNEVVGNRQIKSGKYQYIDELVTKINEYNDILSLWIKMKQGSLNLNIESFALKELFEVVAKGKRTFENKNITLTVDQTDTWVKADRPLTLFMINTLMENARKYTPEGGHVEVKAEDYDEYVEISVTDDGPGMSSEDVTKILGEKVYNSADIGLNNKAAEDIKKNKGYGFGLMNCKGIIEKYRKTSSIFDVCKFNIESEPGKGSSFRFRLPHGMKRLMLVALLVIGACSCSQPQSRNNSKPHKKNPYSHLLQRASDMADTAYYCNVMEKYKLSLIYADSAIVNLNAYYKKQSHNPKTFMTLTGYGTPAETQWWNSMIESDYYVILDIRNEASVAFLALKDWNNYYYNNTAYTQLYKLVSEDYSLEDYCRSLKNSTNNKIVGGILFIIIIFICFAVYYFLYIRKRILNRLDLEQVIEINKQLLSSSTENDEEIVKKLFDAMNELFPIDALGLAVIENETNKPQYAFNSQYTVWNEALRDVMEKCQETQTKQTAEEGRITAIPLIADMGETHKRVGIMAFISKNKNDAERNDLLIALISRYLSIVLFNRIVMIAGKYRDIETAEDEARRAAYEEELIHVQNMVLDNCLSTIKHETIYYPNRIKQIVDHLKTETMPQEKEKSLIEDMNELIDYYKGIFTILSSCAARQLDDITFRRKNVEIGSLIEHAQKYFKKSTRKLPYSLNLTTHSINGKVVGDEIQLKYLVENLIDEAVTYSCDGTLDFSAKEDGEYIRFLFTDQRRNKSQKELNQLFYPDLQRMEVDTNGALHGTEYLICKQIIRDHDEFSGHRGSRINAEICPEGGFTIYFTIQKHRNKN